jgi:hypothetical protein
VKSIRGAAILFSLGSSGYWLAVSWFQYVMLREAFRASPSISSPIFVAIYLLPAAVYAVACFFIFHWMKRRIVRLIATPERD